MPPHLSYLFRAKRPIEPLRAIHKPVYKNRPLQPLIDAAHCGHQSKETGLFGKVNQEDGEKWLSDLFEDKKPQTAPQQNNQTESKAETRKRL